MWFTRNDELAAVKANLSAVEEQCNAYRTRMLEAQRRVRELEKRTPELVERMCHQLPGHGGLHSAFDGTVWPTGRPPASPQAAVRQGWTDTTEGWHWNPAAYDYTRPRRYNQCDNTCTVDCGHCKGKGGNR